MGWLVGIIVVVLVVAVVVGVISMSGGRTVIKFEKFEVYPQYRCPGRPVTVEWASQGKPIKLSVNGKDETLNPNQSPYEIPGKILDQGPDDTIISAAILAQYGGTTSQHVYTVRGVQKYRRQTTKTDNAYEYDYDFPKKIWEDDLLFVGVELIDPRSYLAAAGPNVGLSVSCEWQYDAGKAVSGTLVPSNQYKQIFAPAELDKSRTWIFKLKNPPVEPQEISAPQFDVFVQCPNG